MAADLAGSRRWTVSSVRVKLRSGSCTSRLSSPGVCPGVNSTMTLPSPNRSWSTPYLRRVHPRRDLKAPLPQVFKRIPPSSTGLMRYYGPQMDLDEVGKVAHDQDRGARHASGLQHPQMSVAIDEGEHTLVSPRKTAST